MGLRCSKEKSVSTGVAGMANDDSGGYGNMQWC